MLVCLLVYLGCGKRSVKNGNNYLGNNYLGNNYLGNIIQMLEKQSMTEASQSKSNLERMLDSSTQSLSEHDGENKQETLLNFLQQMKADETESEVDDENQARKMIKKLMKEYKDKNRGANVEKDQKSIEVKKQKKNISSKSINHPSAPKNKLYKCKKVQRKGKDISKKVENLAKTVQKQQKLIQQLKKGVKLGKDDKKSFDKDFAGDDFIHLNILPILEQCKIAKQLLKQIALVHIPLEKIEEEIQKDIQLLDPPSYKDQTLTSIIAYRIVFEITNICTFFRLVKDNKVQFIM
ncbi:hypothetical protein TRFO_19587 [Tritrichomonas foetus]|uniref:Uncharacterized protein n=1 Tax=Tritrichomonas foetus TaxID=1144522 RepID=A0A1J4KJ00_9EUKA|nr:hypothetical protein TRFO_19587 [Tritrichomonas foetus]|eukprot:OHT10912.1 hypothetical protein TRFO_19587 [Tritrichomonas foetus]